MIACSLSENKNTGGGWCLQSLVFKREKLLWGCKQTLEAAGACNSLVLKKKKEKKKKKQKQKQKKKFILAKKMLVAAGTSN
jgi:hypothetical protein